MIYCIVFLIGVFVGTIFSFVNIYSAYIKSYEMDDIYDIDNLIFDVKLKEENIEKIH